MPTSSIFASFDINDKKTAEVFVEVLAASAKDPSVESRCTGKSVADRS